MISADIGHLLQGYQGEILNNRSIQSLKLTIIQLVHFRRWRQRERRVNECTYGHPHRHTMELGVILQPWLGYRKDRPRPPRDILRLWLAVAVQEERCKHKLECVSGLSVCSGRSRDDCSSRWGGVKNKATIIHHSTGQLVRLSGNEIFWTVTESVLKPSAQKARNHFCVFYIYIFFLRMDGEAQVDGRRRRWGAAVVKFFQRWVEALFGATSQRVKPGTK